MDQGIGIRLWTRLARGMSIDPERPDADEYAIRESVREYLAWILGSRRGDAPACGDFGIPDLSRVIAGLPKMESEFSKAIEECIRKYEPRISSVRVRLVDGNTIGGSRVQFTVEVVLKSFEESSYWRITGKVDTDTFISLT